MVCPSDRRTQAQRLPEATLPVIARFFELTLDDHAPLRRMCEIAIENMKSEAVPFLLGQARGNDATRREKAIELLSLVGHCGGEPYKFVDQVLGRAVIGSLIGATVQPKSFKCFPEQ